MLPPCPQFLAPPLHVASSLLVAAYAAGGGERAQRPRVEKTLVDMYAECADMNSAWKLFDGMQVRSVVSWTSLLSGLARLGQVDEARDLFDGMPERETLSWTAMVMCRLLSSGRHWRCSMRCDIAM
jgi:pentatricopeptide repeat protein